LAHLATFRKGWENERLAEYLLSRFSFVARPTSIADDLGSDFFCTIFDIIKISGKDALLPRISCAIQVKSSFSDICADHKVEYLMGLELPFFVAVVKQSPPEMRIYSAELLPLLFSELGKPQKLSLIPVEVLDPDNYLDGSNATDARLKCHLVSTLSVNDDRATLQPKIENLIRICARARNNIATRVNEEHVYDIDGIHQKIIAGSGSAMHFRENVLKRLGEVFLNFSVILGEAPPDETLAAEITAFEALYHQLEKINNGSLPPVISQPYNILKQKIERISPGRVFTL
jgi:hypothetical protein